MTETLRQQLYGEQAAEALSAMCVLARSAKGKAEAEAILGDRSILYTLASDERPKVRKNVYRLIGALEHPKDAEILTEALQRETTLFAVPSLLLALGRLGQKETLQSYSVPESTCESMDKHIAEIAIAYSKAMQQFDPVERTELLRLERPVPILCYAPKGFVDELRKELIGLGFQGTVCGDAIRVETDDVERLYRAECMTEALLPIRTDVPLEPKAIANAVQDCIGTSYRIELRGFLKDRTRFIERLKMMLDGRNNPSNYDCELRIECRFDRCDLFWKLWNVRDERYGWRKEAIAASMHPATAKALASYALSFVKTAHPHVLDPFCGSGALLFSAERCRDCASLLGVDKSGHAVEIARGNAKQGKSRARFVCRDILRFEAKTGAELVLSNLPFGNRVGSHADNEQLYRRFIKRLPYLLTDDGVAVLYTTDGKLMERCIAEQPWLQLKEKRRTEAGGLSPWVFVIDKVRRS